ncbi:MAG: hypothetical protein WD604_10745 [Balneolaceae bacterium]
MAVQMDLIVPPAIMGFIIILVFSVNSFILETSVDNRLIYEMQNFADVSVVLLQDELRSLKSIEELTDSTLRFTSTDEETISIYREGRNLNIARHSTVTSVSDTLAHAARLASLSFTPQELVGSVPTLLHVRVVTESTADQQVGADNGNRIRAYAEKQVYLRNIYYE